MEQKVRVPANVSKIPPVPTCPKPYLKLSSFSAAKSAQNKGCSESKEQQSNGERKKVVADLPENAVNNLRIASNVIINERLHISCTDCHDLISFYV